MELFARFVRELFAQHSLEDFPAWVGRDFVDELDSVHEERAEPFPLATARSRRALETRLHRVLSGSYVKRRPIPNKPITVLWTALGCGSRGPAAVQVVHGTNY